MLDSNKAFVSMPSSGRVVYSESQQSSDKLWGFKNYYRPPEVWAPLLCFRIEVSDMRLLARFKLLGVPQTLFPLLKGELKGEEALEGPKSASPEGRMIAVCRGLLADMPSNRKENHILHEHVIPLAVLQEQTMY